MVPCCCAVTGAGTGTPVTIFIGEGEPWTLSSDDKDVYAPSAAKGAVNTDEIPLMAFLMEDAKLTEAGEVTDAVEVVVEKVLTAVAVLTSV